MALTDDPHDLAVIDPVGDGDQSIFGGFEIALLAGEVIDDLLGRKWKSWP